MKNTRTLVMKFNLKKYAFYIAAFLSLFWVSCSETNQYFDPSTDIVLPGDNANQLPDGEKPITIKDDHSKNIKILD